MEIHPRIDHVSHMSGATGLAGQRSRGRILKSASWPTSGGRRVPAATARSWAEMRFGIERSLLGLGMSALAWLLERLLLRSANQE
jgi:hypothetical protein